MRFVYPSNGVAFTIVLTIKTKSPVNMSIFATDLDLNFKWTNKYNGKQIIPTYYIDRTGIVDGERTFELKFPMSPKQMFLYVYNTEKGNMDYKEDDSFEITDFRVENLKKYNLIESKDVFSFIDLAEFFSKNASNISATKAGTFNQPSIYRSKCGKFCIAYFDKIRDRKTGRILTTPARIGHESGVIEVAKDYFINYTVPMRMAILLHEYSHKYMNPLSNLDIGDEVGADINAINIYLGLGYPTIEAEYAFLKVFKNANNAGNHKRYIIIDDFIKKFIAGELESKTKETYF